MARVTVDLGAEKKAARDAARREPQRCCQDENCTDCYGSGIKTDMN